MSNSEHHQVRTVRHRADELFAIEVAPPRVRQGDGLSMPGVFNLRFRYGGHDAAALAGGGIYAVLHRKQLLYIGIFTGDRKVPFASDVASQRYWKHLEALTLRGRNIGFTPANYDEAIALPLGECALSSALRESLAPRGTGAVKTYPCKVQFASEHWEAFSRLERDAAVLQDFSFVYGRVGPEEFAPDLTYQQVKNYLSAVESHLIEQHAPRCNLDRRKVNARHLEVGPPLSAWSGLHGILSRFTGSPSMAQAA